MAPNATIKATTWIALAIGVAIFAGLLVQVDLKEIGLAVAAAGWGILWVSLWRFVPIGLDAVGWARMVDAEARPGLFGMTRMRWVGESVNTLLPVAQVGGDVVRARLLALEGLGAPRAGASVVADFTVGLAVQLVFTVLGTAVLLVIAGPGDLMGPVLSGLLVAGLVVAGFYGAQRLGLFGVLEKLAHAADWSRLAGGAGALDTEVRGLYRRHGALLACGAWRLVGWFARIGETWLILWFMGVPVTLAEALVMEALSNAVRSAAFAVPGAVGAQEGGIVALGLVLGLDAETAMALALVKRLRELVVSLPGLWVWWRAEKARSPVIKRAPKQGPLEVGVLVDLEWRPGAGGHVKCWERFAAAAARRGDVRLTVHYSGPKAEIHDVAPNVTYAIHPPVFSTARLPFLSHAPDHTDLAGFHPGLARHLGSCDVVHTTDAFFAYAKTALKVTAAQGIPLVNSVHTDTPGYTRIFAAQTIERLAGKGGLSRLLLGGLRLHEKAERGKLRDLARHQARSAFALVSREDEKERALRVLPEGRVGLLRRGIDRDLFSPARRDRARLEADYAIPEDRPVVFFAGRLNRGKNVLVLAEAVKRLVEDGLDLHLLCAGVGEDRDVILETLGDHATCPGSVPAEDVARLYASSDVFALPSEIEVFGNVVMEGLASGLPVVVAEKGGMGRLVRAGETGVVVTGAGAEAWAGALRPLVADPERREAMGRAARAFAETELPSWDDVLDQDLMPVWRKAAGKDAA